MIRIRSVRRCFQYRLRTLLVFVAVCGVAVRLLGQPIVNARRQASAAAAVEAAGGSTYHCRGKPLLPGWMPRWSAMCWATATFWLVRRVASRPCRHGPAAARRADHQ